MKKLKTLLVLFCSALLTIILLSGYSAASEPTGRIGITFASDVITKYALGTSTGGFDFEISIPAGLTFVSAALGPGLGGPSNGTVNVTGTSGVYDIEVRVTDPSLNNFSQDYYLNPLLTITFTAANMGCWTPVGMQLLKFYGIPPTYDETAAPNEAYEPADRIVEVLPGAPHFQGLGDLPGGDFASRAWGVSADGSVVVGDSRTTTESSGTEAFRWSVCDGTMVGLGYLPGGSLPSQAFNASHNGSVVVGTSFSSQGIEAFRLTSGTGMVGLGDLPGSNFNSQAGDVSPDGNIVVGHSRSGSGPEAFLWTSTGGMVGLGDLPGGIFYSRANAVSADGTVVVGSGRGTNSSGDEAFRWTSTGGMVGLGDLLGGNFSSYAADASSDGSVVVGRGASASGGEAFRWTSTGGMVGLGDLPGGGFYSTASAVTADGSVVVGQGTSAAGNEAFIWDSTNGMRSLQTMLTNDLGLDLTGWTLESATENSDDGLTIVGYGINPSGDREAWMARIPDTDGDGVLDVDDNCPTISNPGQEDVLDGDGVGDVCDNCPNDINPGQEDNDRDAYGVFRPDGLGDACDNCDYVNNPGQENIDGDANGDACDICPNDLNDQCQITQSGEVSGSGTVLEGEEAQVQCTLEIIYSAASATSAPLYLFPPDDCNTVLILTEQGGSEPIKLYDCIRGYAFGDPLIETESDQVRLDPEPDPDNPGQYRYYHKSTVPIALSKRFDDAELFAEVAPKLATYDVECSYDWTQQDPDIGSCNDPEGRCFETIIVSVTGSAGQISFLSSERVEIDIVPDNINLGSYGKIPVIIYGNATIDVTDIIPESVQVGGAGVAVKGKGTRYMMTVDDFNEDNILDLKIHIETQTLMLTEGAESVLLTGETSSGTQFGGEDVIGIVPPK